MRSEIYDYDERLERYKRIIKGLRNGGLALKFLDHLAALGLSVARVSKYASHLPALLRVIVFHAILCLAEHAILKHRRFYLFSLKEHFAFRAVLLICSSRNHIDFPVFFLFWR